MKRELLNFIGILNDFGGSNKFIDDFYYFAETKGLSESETDKRFSMLSEFLTDKGYY